MKKILFIFLILTAVFFTACTTSGDLSAELRTDKVMQTEEKASADEKSAVKPFGGSGTIVVLHTNDHHGHPLSFFNYPAPGQGGLPARATLINQIRAENENVLVLDAGDVNMGRPESMFLKPNRISSATTTSGTMPWQ
jgi:2',3'-cyclic-nucleotide 2'-phosphodiesterase (5'-nucleotidase family)